MNKKYSVIVWVVLILLFFCMLIQYSNADSLVEIHGSFEGGFVVMKHYVQDIFVTSKDGVLFVKYMLYLKLLNNFKIGGYLRNDFIQSKFIYSYIPLISYYNIFVEFNIRFFTVGFRHECIHSGLNEYLKHGLPYNFDPIEYNSGYEEIYIKLEF